MKTIIENVYVVISILVIGIFIGLLCSLFFVPACAYPYVNQRDTINQSETYDMSTVVGFGKYAGKFAHWKNWYDEATTVEPDVIVNLFEKSYSIKNLYAVYIDPAIWKTGNWYRYSGTDDISHEDTFAFTVRSTQLTQSKSPEKSPEKSQIKTSVSPTISTQQTVVPPTNSTVIITLPMTPTPTPNYTKLLNGTFLTPAPTVEPIERIPTLHGLPSQLSTSIVGLGIAILLFVVVRKF